MSPEENAELEAEIVGRREKAATLLRRVQAMEARLRPCALPGYARADCAAGRARTAHARGPAEGLRLLPLGERWSCFRAQSWEPLLPPQTRRDYSERAGDPLYR